MWETVHTADPGEGAATAPAPPGGGDETEVAVRRLVTPAVRDAVTGAAVPAGPEVDEERARREYRRAHPDRRHAVAMRALARPELRPHELVNTMPED